jgi:neutral ceramidase
VESLTDRRFFAGCTTLDITPPLGVCLAGHFNTRHASGLHDPLTAQALVLGHGEARVALVGADLIAVSAEMTAAVRERVRAATGLPPDHLMLWATHTHAGPSLVAGDGGARDEAYCDLLVSRLAGAVIAAANRMRPASLRGAWGSEDRIALNRRYRLKDGSVRTNPGVGNPDIARVDGPSDPTVGALFVDTDDGLSAVLVNFGCHLDVLGNGNILFSADYPYYLRRALRSVYGGRVVVAFANGPCGNLNHINVFANRRQGGYDLARMMGMMLAGEVLKIEPGAQSLSGDAVWGRSHTLDLPRRPYTETETTEFQATLADDRVSDIAYAKVRARTHLALSQRGDTSTPVEVQALRLGDLALLGIPAEYFVEYGLELRQRSPLPHTFVVELANDCLGYVPTPQAFDEGGYEGTSARFTRDAGPLLAEAALRLVES